MTASHSILREGHPIPGSSTSSPVGLASPGLVPSGEVLAANGCCAKFMAFHQMRLNPERREVMKAKRLRVPNLRAAAAA
jgi:hypothetical protein